MKESELLFIDVVIAINIYKYLLICRSPKLIDSASGPHPKKFLTLMGAPFSSSNETISEKKEQLLF